MADAWLDRTGYGYVPGEKIQFNANIDNFSGKSVRGTTVQLIQVIQFTLIHSKMIANLSIRYMLTVHDVHRWETQEQSEENSLAK
jgi:hypothetical protein